VSVSHLCALALALALGCSGTDGLLSFELTRDDIQKRLDAKFPIEKEKLFVKVVLADPRVLLEPGKDSIGIDLEVTVDAPALEPRSGRLAARGRLSYDAEKQAFFLREPSIERIDLGSLKPEHADRARKAIRARRQGAQGDRGRRARRPRRPSRLHLPGPQPEGAHRGARAARSHRARRQARRQARLALTLMRAHAPARQLSDNAGR
jgi:hypothetical protein